MTDLGGNLTRRQLIRRTVGGVVSVGLAGSAPSRAWATPRQAAAPSAKDTLSVAYPDTPPSFDGDQVDSLLGEGLTANCYGGDIVRFDVVRRGGILVSDFAEPTATGGINRGLAESMKVSKDLRTYEFVLRDDAKSAYGNPITAEDVRWSFERSRALKSLGGFFNGVQFTKSPSSLEVVNHKTVRFHLPKPNFIFLKIDAMRQPGIFDSVESKKHATSSDPWAKAFLGANTAGYGAYQVESFVKGQQLILAANPNYFGGKVPMQKVLWRVVPDASSREALLVRGDVDVAANLEPLQLQKLKSAKGIKIYSYTGNEFENLRFQLKYKPFRDPRVRQAIAYAIPYDQILQDVYYGFGSRMRSILPSIISGYTDRYWPYETNMAKAQSLLKKSGVGKFTFELMYDVTLPQDQQTATIIKTALAPLGITVNLRGVPTSVYTTTQFKRSFQAMLGLNWPFVPDAGYDLFLYWYSGQFFNVASFSDRTFDKTVAGILGAVDSKKRLALIHKAQEIYAQQIPWVPLVNPGYHVAHRDTVDGFVWYGENGIRFERVHSV